MLYIRLGLKENLDVSFYSNSNYSGEQMEQIRLGLKEDLDVSIYAKSEYSWEQMKKIRKRLLKKNKFNWFHFV